MRPRILDWLFSLNSPRSVRKTQQRTPGPRSPRLTLQVLEDRTLLSSISGIAFLDFNANGRFDNPAPTVPNASGVGSTSLATDQGVPGVTVTAFDANDQVAATTTTGANGRYTL